LIAPTERRRKRLAPPRRPPAGACSPSAHLPSGTRILNKTNNLDAVFAFFSRSHGNTLARGALSARGRRDYGGFAFVSGCQRERRREPFDARRARRVGRAGPIAALIAAGGRVYPSPQSCQQFKPCPLPGARAFRSIALRTQAAGSRAPPSSRA